MDKLIDAQVIVVGGGIAGLTAAWKLKQFGIDVLVLEAVQEVGGRMKSIQFEDGVLCPNLTKFTNRLSIGRPRKSVK